MGQSTLDKLLPEIYSNTVFPDSFTSENGEDQSAHLAIVVQQVGAVAVGMHSELSGHIAEAMPEFSKEEADRVAGHITTKATGFVAALVFGEINDIKRLIAICVSIGLMYFIDQTIDRGDPYMPLAVQYATAAHPKDPEALHPIVKARATSLEHMTRSIGSFCKPEDKPFVQDCYDQQVLHNEVILHNLSQEYLTIEDETARAAFLEEHGEEIATLMTIDAGFPSVSSSLYALYAQHNAALPLLEKVYADKVITDTLTKCNVFARILDEYGDRTMDSGVNPEWGVFVINPFNQYHPRIIDTFCKLSNLSTEDTAAMADAFKTYHANESEQQTQGQRIIDILLKDIRSHFVSLPTETWKTHDQYLRLCKRVLEICHVNLMGDIALAGDTPDHTS